MFNVLDSLQSVHDFIMFNIIYNNMFNSFSKFRKTMITVVCAVVQNIATTEYGIKFKRFILYF